MFFVKLEPLGFSKFWSIEGITYWGFRGFILLQGKKILNISSILSLVKQIEYLRYRKIIRLKKKNIFLR
jgi:hypothetical protein